MAKKKLGAKTPEVKEEIKAEVKEEVKTATVPSIDSPGVVAGVPDGKGGLRTPPEGSKAMTMLRFLASLPKVRTRIPREAKEPAGAFHDVIQNGLHVFVLKGVAVEVPSRIDEVLAKSYFDTEKAINDMKIVDPFTGVARPARVDLQSENDKQALNA